MYHSYVSLEKHFVFIMPNNIPAGRGLLLDCWTRNDTEITPTFLNCGTTTRKQYLTWVKGLFQYFVSSTTFPFYAVISLILFI